MFNFILVSIWCQVWC